MKSPAEAVMGSVDQQLETKKQNQESYAKGRAIVGNIDRAFEILHSWQPVELRGYGRAEGETLNVVLRKQSMGGHRGGGFEDYNTDHLIIQGSVSRDGIGESESFDMYRVARVDRTKGLKGPHPEYEIDVTDGNKGFMPLAIVMQNPDGRLGSDANMIFLGTDWHDKVDPQTPSIQERGLFVDPHAEAMIAEVHTILGMATAQVEATPVPLVQLAA